jgi:hypothetical protein
MKYTCKNYRQNKYGQSFCNSSPSAGIVLADMYNEDGSFYRTAAVADCGSERAAIEHARKQNEILARQHQTEATRDDSGTSAVPAE